MSLRGRPARPETVAEVEARRLAAVHAPRLGRTVESVLPEARRALAKLRRALGGRYPAGVLGVVMEIMADPRGTSVARRQVREAGADPDAVLRDAMAAFGFDPDDLPAEADALRRTPPSTG